MGEGEAGGWREDCGLIFCAARILFPAGWRFCDLCGNVFLSGCGGSLTAVYAGMADFGRCFWVGNVTFFKILSNNFRDTKQALSQVAVRKLNFLLMSLIIFLRKSLA